MDKQFETVLIGQCAPTLAGMKPANLFLYQSSDREAILKNVAYWAEAFAPYGISLSILKECDCKSSCLIYMYRTEELARILLDRLTSSFLQTLGYRSSDGCDSLLQQLSGRLCLGRAFPHEIGIFLGYPLFDVISFMEHGGRNYAFCGYWKAYMDPVGARKCSEQYRKCISSYKTMFQNGTPILQLIVAA